ncbi:hypothetical protein CRENBAI_023885 [Crenichthys baileyi]|uniref:Uncharacterized protein n=1 Tax=Crenichthys baileyi TaxID=28760 RepID=A0AAV9RD53_9TELE
MRPFHLPGKLQHETAELGGNKQTHTSPPPLPVGHSRVEESPRADTEEIRATDIQRPPKAQEPQENHRRDYRNPPREEQWRVPGEPRSSDSAEAPGSRIKVLPAGLTVSPSRSQFFEEDCVSEL